MERYFYFFVLNYSKYTLDEKILENLVKNVKRKRTRTLKTSRIEVVYFCTECGKQLEDFCFSREASDLKATHSRFENCKQKKRFKGEACAKLFIAEPVDTFPSDD